MDRTDFIHVNLLIVENNDIDTNNKLSIGTQYLSSLIDAKSYQNISSKSEIIVNKNVPKIKNFSALLTLSTVTPDTVDNVSHCLSSSRSTNDASTISTYAEKKGGRLPGLMTYSTIQYNAKNYIVCVIQHKSNDVKFIIDEDDFFKIYNRPWHLSSGKYIATNETELDGKIKEVYLHNLLKESELTDSEKEYVIHINHNTFDNRSENLRIVKKDEFYTLKSKRKRTITLPSDCGFNADDIPRYISYMKAGGEHGDRFVIEIPKLNIVRKLTSSKKKSLKEKLDEAITILNEIYKEYPYLNPSIDDSLKESLDKSYNEIIERAMN